MTRVGVFGRRQLLWVALARFLVPGMMLISYVFLTLVADTSTSNKLWIAGGYGFVLSIWFTFRYQMDRASVARAAAVGDADRLLELADEQLARKRSPAARAPFEIYRALAYDVRGDWPAVLAALDLAKAGGTPRPPWQIYAATARVAALVETGRLAEARAVLDRELPGMDRGPAPRLLAQAHLRARLEHARVLAAEGRTDEALELLQRVIDDVRTTDSLREMARRVRAPLVERAPIKTAR